MERSFAGPFPSEPIRFCSSVELGSSSYSPSSLLSRGRAVRRHTFSLLHLLLQRRRRTIRANL